MASPVEMMAKQLIRAIGVDPEMVMVKVQEMHAMFSFGAMNMHQANRRLHRIETHLGLSDIEPVPQLMVITNEKSPTSDVAGDGGNGNAAR